MLGASDTHQIKRRRTQAERSAETRSRVIRSAIQCLYQLGYSATTTSLVARKADVSRGAMTHHFPSKLALMTAVVSFVHEDETAEFIRQLAPLAPQETFFAVPEAAWRIFSRPEGIAVTEIMLASRSDPALAQRLREIQAGIELDAREQLAGSLKAAGFQPRSDFAAMRRLLAAAIRGLALEALSVPAQKEIEDAVKLLSGIVRLFYPPPGDKEATRMLDRLIGGNE